MGEHEDNPILVTAPALKWTRLNFETKVEETKKTL